MRVLLVAIALAFASPASAAVYSLTDAAGDVQCILYDGVTPYVPPAGFTLSSGPVQTCTPLVATPTPNPTVISASAFLARFTAAEQQAAWAAATKDATGAIGAGLTQGLTAQAIDLTAPALKTWMDALVTAGAITAPREAAILTP